MIGKRLGSSIDEVTSISVVACKTMDQDIRYLANGDTLLNTKLASYPAYLLAHDVTHCCALPAGSSYRGYARLVSLTSASSANHSHVIFNWPYICNGMWDGP